MKNIPARRKENVAFLAGIESLERRETQNPERTSVLLPRPADQTSVPPLKRVGDRPEAFGPGHAFSRPRAIFLALSNIHGSIQVVSNFSRPQGGTSVNPAPTTHRWTVKTSNSPDGDDLV